MSLLKVYITSFMWFQQNVITQRELVELFLEAHAEWEACNGSF